MQGMNDPSTNALLHLRSEGRCNRTVFTNRIVRMRTRDGFHLHPTWSRGSGGSRDSAAGTAEAAPKRIVSDRSVVTSLDVDPGETRFLLAGNVDGIVSIYDLSRWGSEKMQILDGDRMRGGRRSSSSRRRGGLTDGGGRSVRSPAANDGSINSDYVHKPIARSVRVRRRRHPDPFGRGYEEETLETPSGHASRVVSVRWYPIDSGAFVSASADGNVLIWDTNEMIPVSCVAPFQFEQQTARTRIPGSVRGAVNGAGVAPAISCMEVSPLLGNSIATGCRIGPPVVKIVDIRTASGGSASHNLVGHRRAAVAITTLQWSPTCEYVLASGGGDRCIRLWDIRKAGSRSCLAVLDQDFQPKDTLTSRPYWPDYSHLALSSSASSSRRKGQGQQGPKQLSPNDYRHVELPTVSSHSNGYVTGLAFTPDGRRLLSSASDGEMKLWDLSSRGGREASPCALPRRFHVPTNRREAHVQNRGNTSSSAYLSAPLKITQDGSSGPGCRASTGSATAWTSSGTQVVGYSLEYGGHPRHLLKGHLLPITAMSFIPNHHMELITAGQDGLILCWRSSSNATTTSGGTKRKRKAKQDKDTW